MGIDFNCGFWVFAARMFDYMDAGKMEGVTFRLMTFTQQQTANISTENEQKELESGRNMALRCEVSSTEALP